MAPSVVTIDASDVDMAIPSAPIPQKRTLLLAPPSIATEESNLHALFTTFDRTTTDLQMLDRLSAGVVSLSTNTYDLVLLLTDKDGSRRTEVLHLLNRGVYAALVPAMKPGAKLQTQDNGFGPAEAMEAVLAGLVQTSAGFEKPKYDASAAVPLRFGAKKNISQKTTPPAPAPAPPMMGIIDPTNNDDYDDDDDELINEDALLDDEDLSRPIMPRSFSLPLLHQHTLTDLPIQPRNANPKRAVAAAPAKTAHAASQTGWKQRIKSDATKQIAI